MMGLKCSCCGPVVPLSSIVLARMHLLGAKLNSLSSQNNLCDHEFKAKYYERRDGNLSRTRSRRRKTSPAVMSGVSTVLASETNRNVRDKTTKTSIHCSHFF